MEGGTCRAWKEELLCWLPPPLWPQCPVRWQRFFKEPLPASSSPRSSPSFFLSFFSSLPPFLLLFFCLKLCCSQTGRWGEGWGWAREGREGKQPSTAAESSHPGSGRHRSRLLLAMYSIEGLAMGWLWVAWLLPSPPKQGSSFLCCLMQGKKRRKRRPFPRLSINLSPLHMAH